MLHIVCDVCSEELKEQGALVFSPPYLPGHGAVKYHLCVKCWDKLVKFLDL